MFIPRKLRDLRVKRGMSKTEIIFGFYRHGLTISRPTLDSWEDGNTSPTAKDLAIIAIFFKVPVEHFFGKERI